VIKFKADGLTSLRGRILGEQGKIVRMIRVSVSHSVGIELVRFWPKDGVTAFKCPSETFDG